MPKFLYLFLFIFLLNSGISAQTETITVFETVKVKNEKRAEAMFFYENNWKVLRQKALEKGNIHSFELVLTEADQKADFEIILITRYADQNQYDKSEGIFQELIAQIGGLKLKNELKPDDFRQNVFVKIGKSQLMFKAGKHKSN